MNNIHNYKSNSIIIRAIQIWNNDRRHQDQDLKFFTLWFTCFSYKNERMFRFCYELVSACLCTKSLCCKFQDLTVMLLYFIFMDSEDVF